MVGRTANSYRHRLFFPFIVTHSKHSRFEYSHSASLGEVFLLIDLTFDNHTKYEQMCILQVVERQWYKKMKPALPPS